MVGGKANHDEGKLPFDREATLDRLGGDEELFRDLVKVFIEDIESLEARLLDGSAKNDVHQVERAAHAIKGLCLTFEGCEAGRVAAVVEAAGRGGKIADAQRELPRLQTEVATLLNALRRQVGTS